MKQDVEYFLTLKDMLTRKLESANIAAKVLETTMGALGVAAGGFATYKFLEGSVEAFNESAQASAQLDASLKSTGNAANLNREALDAQADAIMKTSLFDDDAITKTQGLLATFTGIKDKIYMEAVPAIADLATKMGGDLQGATIQVGKALNDPIQGMTALRRVGVSFSESQQNVIKKLQETGHMAEAQKLVLAELAKEFGGSAAASALAGTGPFVVMQHEFQNVREEIGLLVVAAGTELLPAFYDIVNATKATVNGIKEIAHWIKRHNDLVDEVTTVVGIATGAYVIYEGVLIAARIATKAQAIWAIVMNAQLAITQILTEGVGISFLTMGISAGTAWALATGGIALVVIAIYELYKHSEKFRQGVTMLKDDAMVAGYALKWMYDKARGDAKGAEEDVARMNELLAERKSIIDGTYNAHKGMLVAGGQAFSMLDYGKDKKNKPIPGAPGADGVDLAPKKASGTKSVTVNIAIGKLIEQFNVNTTNLKESEAKIKELVANVLLSAVNDSGIVADI